MPPTPRSHVVRTPQIVILTHEDYEEGEEIRLKAHSEKMAAIKAKKVAQKEKQKSAKEKEVAKKNIPYEIAAARLSFYQHGQLSTSILPAYRHIQRFSLVWFIESYYHPLGFDRMYSLLYTCIKSVIPQRTQNVCIPS